MTTTTKYTLKKVGLILGAGFILTSAALLYAGHQAMANPHPDTVVTAVVPTYTMDPRLVQIADSAGIDKAKLAKFQPVIGEPTDAQFCGGPTSRACTIQYPNGSTKIYLYPKALTEPFKVQVGIFSHEYLHTVFYAIQDKTTTCTAMMSYYDNSGWVASALHQRMKPYERLGVGSTDFCSELHSIIGTEVNDAELPVALVKYYKQYLPNRSALPSYF